MESYAVFINKAGTKASLPLPEEVDDLWSYVEAYHPVLYDLDCVEITKSPVGETLLTPRSETAFVEGGRLLLKAVMQTWVREILFYIRDHGLANYSDLYRAIPTDRKTLTRRVKDLVEQGLIATGPGALANSVGLTLTERGKKVTEVIDTLTRL